MLDISPIAIIPARINSRRVKFKNITIFRKKPLIYWTIEAAIKSKIFSKIFVSTDNNIIKKNLKKFKKQIFFLPRPKKLSGSKTKSETLIKYLIKKNNLQKKYETFFLLQATSPKRNKNHINSMWNIYCKEKLNNFISVSKKKNKNKIKNKSFIYLKNRKEKIKKDHFFYPNGAIYIRNILDFLDKPKFLLRNTSYFNMDVKYSLDVDNYKDFE